MAMLVEHAAASTECERILNIMPTAIRQRLPVTLGSREEVDLLVGYHAACDSGEKHVFTTPLFNARSLFRIA